MMSSTFLRARNVVTSRVVRSSCSKTTRNNNVVSRGFVTKATNNTSTRGGMAAAAILLGSGCMATMTLCDKPVVGSVPLGTGIMGGALTKEEATGITFPDMVNGMKLVGVGVRIKYVFVKIYAVGTYMDPLAMSAVKSRPKEEIAQALLDPTYPRVIRIVLNRELTAEKFTDALAEALEPRMGGQDAFALEEFKKMNPSVTLPNGSQFLMTIRGDTLLYENPAGQFGTIRSHVFCKAMCDVYYGSDAVSPTHKTAVLENIPKKM